jgi:FdrA protein
VSAATASVVRVGLYLDSVALMRISATLKSRPGVEEAALMVGTEANRRLLADAGLLGEEGGRASPNDLIIAVRARSRAAADDAIAEAQAALAGTATKQAADAWRPRSLAAGTDMLPGANLALISVPGEFAARERASRCAAAST